MIDLRTASYGAFLLRVTSGALFLAHAAMKYFIFTPAGTAQFFTSVGLPGALAYLVIGAETLGGVALVLGIRARAVSLALIAVLAGAVASVHLQAGFFFNNPNGGWEYPAFWMVALAAQALIGGGAFQLDRVQVGGAGRVPATV